MSFEKRIKGKQEDAPVRRLLAPAKASGRVFYLIALIVYHGQDHFAINFCWQKGKMRGLRPFIIKMKGLIDMSKTVKTGQKAPVSGQYKPVGSKTEITLVEGKRVPPTPSGATKFTLVDRTVHKGGSK